MALFGCTLLNKIAKLKTYQHQSPKSPMSLYQTCHNFAYCRFLIGFVFFFWSIIISTAHCDEQVANTTGIETINTILNQARHPYLLHGDIADQVANLQKLYSLSQNRLIWFKGGTEGSTVYDLLSLLGSAPEHGLKAEFYDAEQLRQKWSDITEKHTASEVDLTLYDVALNIALLRYMSDLHFGRARPKGLTINSSFTLPDIDLAERIYTSAQTGNVSVHNENLQPNLPGYRNLKLALARYRSAKAELGDLPQNFKTPLKGDQIADLKQFLTRLEDMAEAGQEQPHESKNKTNRLDKPLINGIKNFQKRHSITPDGKLNAKTLNALNIPLSDRINEIELAMERFRWLPQLNETPYIIVNIPAFQLWGYPSLTLSGEAQPMSMKVIVGESLDKQTPVLISDMQFLQFRPYWNVPPSIAKKELLPKLRSNPDYLASHDMELVNGFGPNAAKYGVNSQTLSQLGQGVLKIRQRPGTKNALGTVKFVFPNNFNVYLHDTSSPKLFKRERRDFSHGCIRIEKPQELAQFVLKNRPEWDEKKISLAMHDSGPKQVQLKQPIPVMIFYSTAMADPDKVTFFEDIYSLNAPLHQRLNDEKQYVAIK